MLGLYFRNGSGACNHLLFLLHLHFVIADGKNYQPDMNRFSANAQADNISK